MVADLTIADLTIADLTIAEVALATAMKAVGRSKDAAENSMHAATHPPAMRRPHPPKTCA